VHCEAALSLQAAYSDPVEDTLIVLRPGPKVVFQYELRFVNRLKSQLLISHLFFLPIKEMPSDREKEARNQAAFWEISPLFWIIPSIFISMREALQRPIAALPGSTRFRSPLASPNGRRA